MTFVDLLSLVDGQFKYAEGPLTTRPTALVHFFPPLHFYPHFYPQIFFSRLSSTLRTTIVRALASLDKWMHLRGTISVCVFCWVSPPNATPFPRLKGVLPVANESAPQEKWIIH